MYDGETLGQKLMAHQNNPIPSLAAQRTDAPPALIAIFERMVANQPEDLFQTMAEVEAALGSWGNSASSSVPPPKPAAAILNRPQHLQSQFRPLAIRLRKQPLSERKSSR